MGIDVAKSKLDGWGKIKSHVSNNDAKSFVALLVWLKQRGCDSSLTKVCMEASWPYGEAATTTPSDGSWIVSVVNPARIKGFAPFFTSGALSKRSN